MALVASLTVAVVAEGPGAPALSRTLDTLAQCSPSGGVHVVGNAAALNNLIHECESDYIAVVRAGEIVSARALELVTEALGNSERIAAVHGLWMPVDEDGRISRHTHREHRATLQKRAKQPSRNGELLALPTFRLSALRHFQLHDAAGIDELLTDLRSRLVHEHDIVLIPRALTGRMSPPVLERGSRWPSAFVPGFFGELRPVRQIRSVFLRMGDKLRPYELLIALARVVPARLTSSYRRTQGSPRHVAYVTVRYPMMTETFIRRELNAVHSSGLPVEVFAVSPDEPPMVPDAASPSLNAKYYGPVEWDAGRRAIRQYLRHHPLRVISAWLFIVRRNDHRTRTLVADLELLYHGGQLASHLERAEVDHVHSPWARRSALPAVIAAKLLGIPLSLHARASEVNRSVDAGEVYDRLTDASFVVVNSFYIESALRSIAGRRRLPPLRMVYNGVDIDRFVPKRKRRDEDRVRILSVGRLIEPKGFRYLLAACGVLRSRGLAFSCEIVGGIDKDDPVTPIELTRMTEELGLGDVVNFTGSRDFATVLGLLESSDILALPCVRARDGSRDVTPNVLLEAMAMSVPVVSTRVGAIPEMIDDGIEGLLVAERDPVALADAIERLMRDAGLRECIGAAGRSRVERQFNSATNVLALRELFSAKH